MVPAIRTTKNSVHFRKAHYRRKKTVEDWHLCVILWHCVNLLNLVVTTERRSVTIKRKQSMLYKRMFPAFFLYLPNTEDPTLDFPISTLQRGPWLAKVVLDFRLWAWRIKNRLTSYFWNTKKRTSRVFNSTFKNVLPTPHLLTRTHNYSCSMLSRKLLQIHSVSFFCSNFCLFHYCILIAHHLARHRIDSL